MPSLPIFLAIVGMFLQQDLEPDNFSPKFDGIRVAGLVERHSDIFGEIQAIACIYQSVVHLIR